MGFFKSTKGSIISDYFSLLEPVANFEPKDACDVALYDDHLEISNAFRKNKIMLSYAKIVDVFYGYRSELIKKPKSVLGRAAAGGILFGGLGAVVGAISAKGESKTVETKKLYFIIGYVDSENNEAYLQFEDTRHYHGKKVAAKLKELCNIEDRDVEL